MLDRLNPKFRVLARADRADEDAIRALQYKFHDVPEEFCELLRDGTEVEMRHDGGAYLRMDAFQRSGGLATGSFPREAPVVLTRASSVRADNSDPGSRVCIRQ